MSDGAAATLGEAMEVQASDFDGHALGEVDLVRSPGGRAIVNGELVLAMRPIGSRIVLIVDGREYCVSIADYWQVMGANSSSVAGGRDRSNSMKKRLPLGSREENLRAACSSP